MHLRMALTLGAACIAGCGNNEDVDQGANDVVVASSCSALSVPDLNESARSFVFAESIGKASDDQELIPDLIWSRWALVGIVEPRLEARRSTCLAVVSVAMVTKAADGTTTVSPGDTRDVIAIDPTTKVFSRFEASIVTPDRLHAAYGPSQNRLTAGGWTAAQPEDFYYVELTGPQLLDTWKAIAAGIEYSGFAAEISATNVNTNGAARTGDPDGKADFDPIATRTWKLKNPSYSLRRGATAEINDVYAVQLDDHFGMYYSGSDGKVAPWNSAVRRWKLPTSANWMDTPLPPPSF